MYLEIRYFPTSSFTFCERRGWREFGDGAISIPMKFCTLDSREIGHSWNIDEEGKREKEKESTPVTNSVPPQIIVTFVRTRVDRPNFARSGKTTVRGQFLERPTLHHGLLVISLSMVETPFDYPRLRRGTTRYKSSAGWWGEAEMVVRVTDSCEQQSGFRARDRLNAVRKAPTDTLLARFLIRISVLSIARGRT